MPVVQCFPQFDSQSSVSCCPSGVRPTLKVANPDGPAVVASDTLLTARVYPVGPASQWTVGTWPPMINLFYFTFLKRIFRKVTNWSMFLCLNDPWGIPITRVTPGLSFTKRQCRPHNFLKSCPISFSSNNSKNYVLYFQHSCQKTS
jgi:hypothetical protein